MDHGMQSFGPPGPQGIPEQPQQGGGEDDSWSFSIVWIFVAIGLIAVGWVTLRDGEGDRQEDAVKAVIEEALTSTDPSICSRLFTHDWLAQQFGASSASPLGTCPEQTVEASEDKASGVDVFEAQVEDGSATASVHVTGGNVGEATMVLSLAQLGGEQPQWKLHHLTEIEINPDRFLEAQRQAVAAEELITDARPLMDCMLDWAEENLTSTRLEAMVLAGDTDRAYAGAFVECREEFRRMAFSVEVIGAETSWSPAELSCISRVMSRSIRDEELHRLYLSFMTDRDAGPTVDGKKNAAIALCTRAEASGALS